MQKGAILSTYHPIGIIIFSIFESFFETSIRIQKAIDYGSGSETLKNYLQNVKVHKLR